MSGPAAAGGAKSPKMCAFFNTPGGCRKGDKCPFKHVSNFNRKYGGNKREEVVKAAKEIGTCAGCMNFECNCLSASEAEAVSMQLPPNMKLYVCARWALHLLGFNSPCPEGCAYVHHSGEVQAAFENIRVAHRDQKTGAVMSLEEAKKRAWTKTLQNIQDNLRAVLGVETVKKGKTKIVIPEWSTEWEPLVKELLSSMGLEDPNPVDAGETAEMLDAQEELDRILYELDAQHEVEEFPGMGDGPDDVSDVNEEYDNEDRFLENFWKWENAKDSVELRYEQAEARWAARAAEQRLAEERAQEAAKAAEQRLMEERAQEAAKAAKRSFAAVCSTPVVSLPPPRNIGGAAPVKKVSAVKNKPWFISLEHDYAAVESWGEEALKDD